MISRSRYVRLLRTCSILSLSICWVAEAAVLALAHRRVEADRVLPGLHDPLGLVDAEADRGGQLLHRRLAARVLANLLALGFEGRDALEHVDRNADRAGMVGHRPGN